MNLSYQLYSSRNWPLVDTLKMLSDIGYTEVETYGGLYEDVAGLKAATMQNGLAITSCHMDIEALEDNISDCIALGKELGVKRIYGPYLSEDKRPTDLAGWHAFAKRLAAVKPKIEEAGFVFGWHNHDFELFDLGNGTIALDVLAKAGIPFELDLGWVHVSGLDVIETIQKYGPLIQTVHIKDRAADGEKINEDGWADVGAGVLNWASILDALKNAGVSHFVIEHDNPSDHERFARTSFEHIKSL